MLQHHLNVSLHVGGMSALRDSKLQDVRGTGRIAISTSFFWKKKIRQSFLVQPQIAAALVLVHQG